jgi:hypothetical protein
MTSNAFDFGPMLDAYVAHCTVGFVDVESGEGRPFGSGTLVRTKTTQGILTCAHVLTIIRQHKEIGICLFPVRGTALQLSRIPVKDCAPHAIAFLDIPETADGRDLAYLPLPLRFMASLLASASVVDLDLHEARSKAPSPSGSTSFEGVVGIIEEITPPAAPKGARLVVSVEGLINVGRVICTRQAKGFDLLEFNPVPGPDFVAPSTYGATSGGGMWRLYVRRRLDGDYDHVETRLIGVVFWETDLAPRNLIGHGPISVFGHLLSGIRRQWP